MNEAMRCEGNGTIQDGWEMEYFAGCSWPLSYWNEIIWSVIKKKKESLSHSPGYLKQIWAPSWHAVFPLIAYIYINSSINSSSFIIMLHFIITLFLRSTGDIVLILLCNLNSWSNTLQQRHYDHYIIQYQYIMVSAHSMIISKRMRLQYMAYKLTLW